MKRMVFILIGGMIQIKENIMTKFEVIITADRANPENNGNVVFGPTTFDRAQGFLDGVAYVNDSALVLKLESVDFEEIDD